MSACLPGTGCPGPTALHQRDSSIRPHLGEQPDDGCELRCPQSTEPSGGTDRPADSMTEAWEPRGMAAEQQTARKDKALTRRAIE